MNLKQWAESQGIHHHTAYPDATLQTDKATEVLVSTSIRLPQSLVNQVRAQAAELGIPATTLIRQWVIERVNTPTTPAVVSVADCCAVDLGVAVTAATSQPVDLHDGVGPHRMHKMADLLFEGEKRRLLVLEQHKASQFEALKRRRAKAKREGGARQAETGQLVRRETVPVSKSYLKTVRAIAAIHARAARRRKDWLRKLASALGELEHVVFEDLKVPNMVKSPAPKPDPSRPGAYLPNGAASSSGLAKVILDSGWGHLRTYTAEKTHTIEVPARYSSQECRACGHTCEENRPEQAIFRCVGCGHENNADLDASEVLEARGRRVLADVAGLPAASAVAGHSRKAPGKAKGLVPARAAA